MWMLQFLYSIPFSWSPTPPQRLGWLSVNYNLPFGSTPQLFADRPLLLLLLPLILPQPVGFIQKVQ